MAVVTFDNLLNSLNIKDCNDHTECGKIQEKIMELLLEKKTFSYDFINDYIYFLKRNLICSYYNSFHTKKKQTKCIDHAENYIDSITNLLSHSTPSNYILKTLIDSKHDQIFKIMINNKCDIPAEVFKYAIKTLGFSEITNLFFSYEKCIIDSNILKTCIENNRSEYIEQILKKGIPVNNEILNNSIKNSNLKIFRILLSHGITLNISHLELACQYSSSEMVNFLLDSKLIPTQKCVTNLFSNQRTHDSIHCKEEIFNSLLKYGYKLTYDDVLLATRNKVQINNFYTYNIKLDDKYLDICAEQMFYPYDFKDVRPNSKTLQKACKSSHSNLAAIKNLVKAGAVPDTLCLREACKKKNNYAIIKYLISAKVKVDFQCILNQIELIYNKSLELLIDTYIKNTTNEEILKELDETTIRNIIGEDKIIPKDAENNNDNAKKTEENNNNNNNNNDKPVVQEINQDQNESNKSDIKEPNENELVEGEYEYEYVDDGYDSENKNYVEYSDNFDETDIAFENSNKEENEVKPKKKIAKKKGNVFKIVKVENPNKIIDSRDLITLNEIKAKLLKMKTGDKISFLNFRNKFLKYIKDSNLFDKNNKMMIKIDDMINKVSGYKKGEYLDFKDLDNFLIKINS